MKTSVSICGVLAMALICLSCSGGFPEREAKRIIEEAVLQTVTFSLGAYTVGGGMREQVEPRPSDLKRRYLSSRDFRVLRAWAEAGVLSIKKDQAYEDFKQGKTFDWKNFQSALEGVGSRVVIEPTEAGLREGKRTNEDGLEFLSFPDRSKCRVTKVHRLEDKRSATDEYKVVHASFTYEPDPFHAKAYAALGVKCSGKQKAVALLKRDQFKGEWSLVAWDFCAEDADFTTSNVRVALSKADVK